MEQKFRAVLMATIFFSTLAVPASKVWAQGVLSRTEINAGYTYASVDQNVGFGSSGRLNSNGWNSGLTIGTLPWLGWEFNFANVRHSESGVAGDVQAKGSEKLFTFVTGPRFILDHGRARPFVHALAGIDHNSLEVSASSTNESFSESFSDNSLAVMLGGGLEVPLSRHVGLTTGADYVLTRHGISGSLADLLGVPPSHGTQHNFRVTAGIVFRLGSGFERTK